MEQATDTNRPAIFECWNGLYRLRDPNRPQGRGTRPLPLRPDPDRDRRSRIASPATAVEIGVAPREYVDALGDVRVMPLDQYESSINTMHTLAQMIADQAAASIDNLKMLQDALTAKEDAAKLVDELEVILEAFRDSFAQSDEHVNARDDRRSAPATDPVRLVPDLHGRRRSRRARAARRPRSQRRRVLGVSARARASACGARWPPPAFAARSTTCATTPTSSQCRGRSRARGDARRADDSQGDDLRRDLARVGSSAGVFTEHELRILAVFCSHASLSMQVSRMQAQSMRQAARGAGARRAAWRARPRAVSVEETLAAIGRCGLDVLGAELGRAALPARAGGAESAWCGSGSTRPPPTSCSTTSTPSSRACLARRACRRPGPAACLAAPDPARGRRRRPGRRRCSWPPSAPSGIRAWSTRSRTSPRSGCATRWRASASAASSSSTTSSRRSAPSSPTPSRETT